MTTIHNPVLRGFEPDPSILRVGGDYYIVTSTFEYHPAVRIHHSRDLAHWSLVGYALDEGFDLAGVPDSAGVWAPSLSYVDGEFWLAYSVVRSADGDDKDIDNYLITAPSVTGPWSAPIYLGSRGFDFSFFHDTDGTHWIVGLQWDHRPGHPAFGGLVLAQYFPDERRTSDETHLLYQEEGLVEGPNLYHLGDWYYLLIAAGGTGWNHGITMARSRNRLGPYERDYAPAVLTTRDAPGLRLQKAGHGELVQTPAGEWVLVHLAARPVLHLGERFSTLGRETSLQRVVFDEDGWLRLAQGGHHPADTVDFDTDPDTSAPGESSLEFTSDGLERMIWNTLRRALPASTIDLTTRPGWLRLRGGHSTASVFEQSMVVQRVTEREWEIDVTVDAEPTSSRQAAGLILWYDRHGWIWLQLTHDRENGRHLRVVTRDQQTRRSESFPIAPGPVQLRAVLVGDVARFSYRSGSDDEWLDVPGDYPLWALSDDHGPRLRFTGLFAGLRAEDLDALTWTADFSDVTVRASRATGGLAHLSPPIRA